MIRCAQNQPIPASGPSPELATGTLYGFRLRVASNGYAEPMIVTVLRKDCSVDLIPYHPMIDGWWWSREPVKAIKIQTVSGAANSVDAWWATRPDDRAETPREPIRGAMLWDSGSIAGGAGFSNPNLLDTSWCVQVAIVADNTGSAVPRGVFWYGYTPSGVGMFTDNTGSVGAGAVATWTIGAYPGPAAGPFAPKPVAVPPALNVAMQAGGVAAGRVYVWGR